MKIIEMPISKIVPYANNPRDNDGAVDAVAASIREFGFKVPVIVDRDNVIVAGHTRIKAAEKLGLSTVPVIRADDLTEEQVRAFRLADNKTSELAEWDFSKLEAELEEIEMDMAAFGFDELEKEISSGDVEEDDFSEELPEEPKSKVGDVYQLGNHRLICGDCTDAAVIDKLLDGKKADLLLTDPPYGIKAVESSGHNNGKKAGGQLCKDNVYAPIIGDDTTNTAKESYGMSLTYSNNQIIFGGNYFTDFLPPSRCWIVWDKKVAGSFADGELAWTSFDKNLRIYEFMWSGMRRQGDKKTEGTKRVHPTQKPVGMLGEIIKDFTRENDSVLDMFGGSGSTLIACEQLNRKCYMCEIDPHYVDVIINRWETLTGKKAEKIR